jgi:hypothetical protein
MKFGTRSMCCSPNAKIGGAGHLFSTETSLPVLQRSW